MEDAGRHRPEELRLHSAEPPLRRARARLESQTPTSGAGGNGQTPEEGAALSPTLRHLPGRVPLG